MERRVPSTHVARIDRVFALNTAVFQNIDERFLRVVVVVFFCAWQTAERRLENGARPRGASRGKFRRRRDERLQSEIQIVRERDERHGPERFSGHEPRGIRDAKRSKPGEKSNSRRGTTSAKRGDEHGLYQGDVRGDGRVVSVVFNHRAAADRAAFV